MSIRPEDRSGREEDVWECLACGAKNPSSDRYCGKCGAPFLEPAYEAKTPDAKTLLSLFGIKGERLIDGRFQLIEQLGQGSMAVLFRGLDTKLDRIVAIKFVSWSAQNGMDPATRRLRLRNEGQILGRLRHPNIVTVYDMGVEDGSEFIIMEFIEGQTVKEKLSAGQPLSVLEAVEIMVQVCEGLAHAHRRGVIHRDLKPSNIMVQPNGIAKITDFGIAKVAFRSRVKEAGVIVGTPYYMSPEQLLGREVDARSDIFSAGIVLYEMVTARKPFTGRTLAEIVRAIISSKFTPPREYNPNVPLDVEAAIRKALVKNREFRYQCITEFHDDLSEWRASVEPEAARIPFAPKAATKRLETAYEPVRERRHRGIGWVLATGLVLLIVTGALVYLNSDTHALRVAAVRLIEEFKAQDYNAVYALLASDFRAHWSLRNFIELPFIGLRDARLLTDAEAQVDRIVFLKNGEANVIVRLRYSGRGRTIRYTMRWVKEPDGWRFCNPGYATFREGALDARRRMMRGAW